MSDIGKAYVQIVPSAKGISGSISSLLGGEATSAGESAGVNVGNGLVSKLKGVIAAAGLGVVVKEALEAGGNLQQSFGGLDTLYEDAAESAKAYAVEAAKAGISANDYAEQAVSFGASLKAAFGGDTQAAMEAANTAILDMADNSAKMGTDIASIQMAYQGFAKQNYTMLDNLKIGYGGTKTEMERLLADAQELSGVEYDIDNLGDVYSAIHVIQENLNLTGVAAEEASTTFTGSFNAMKAAATNLLADLTLGNDIAPALATLSSTVQAFMVNNLFPMVGNLLESLPDLIGNVGGILTDVLESMGDPAALLDLVMNLVISITDALLEVAPSLVTAGWELMGNLATAIMEYDWMEAIQHLIDSFKTAFDEIATGFMSGDTSLVDGILSTLSDALPKVLEGATQIVNQLGVGIQESIPNLVTAASDIVTSLITFLLESLPQIIQFGVDIIMNLVSGIVASLPQLAIAVLDIIGAIATYLVENIDEIIQFGADIITDIVTGLLDAVVLIVEAMPEIISAIWDTITEVDWLELGKNIIRGIIKGIQAMANALYDAIVDIAEQAFQSVKDFFGIESPSKLMANEIGHYLPSGIAVGAEKNTKPLIDEMQTLSVIATDSFTPDYSGIEAPSAEESKIDAVINLLSRYLPDCAEKVTIDGNSLISGINRGLGEAYA